MLKNVDEILTQMKSLEIETTKLTQRISKLEEYAEYLIYKLALHDLNTKFKLDVKHPNHFSKINLKKLRNGHSNAHYMYDETDDCGVLGYKTLKALAMIKNIDKTTATKFTENFGTSFLKAVIQHFEGYDPIVTVSAEEIKMADEWWTL